MSHIHFRAPKQGSSSQLDDLPAQVEKPWAEQGICPSEARCAHWQESLL